MAKKRKTPNATPLRTLAREMVFSYIQLEYGVPALTKVMNAAIRTGKVKNAPQFRKWLITELCETVNTLDRWLATMPDGPPKPPPVFYAINKAPKEPKEPIETQEAVSEPQILVIKPE